MPEFRTFSGPVSSVIIEVEPGESEGSGGNNLRDMMEILLDIAHASSDEMQRLPKEKRPNEFEISFGLRVLSGGVVAVSLGDDQANFHIRMKWGGASSGNGPTGSSAMLGNDGGGGR